MQNNQPPFFAPQMPGQIMQPQQPAPQYPQQQAPQAPAGYPMQANAVPPGVPVAPPAAPGMPGGYIPPQPQQYAPQAQAPVMGQPMPGPQGYPPAAQPQAPAGGLRDEDALFNAEDFGGAPKLDGDGDYVVELVDVEKVTSRKPGHTGEENWILTLIVCESTNPSAPVGVERSFGVWIGSPWARQAGDEAAIKGFGKAKSAILAFSGFPDQNALLTACQGNVEAVKAFLIGCINTPGGSGNQLMKRRARITIRTGAPRARRDNPQQMYTPVDKRWSVFQG